MDGLMATSETTDPQMDPQSKPAKIPALSPEKLVPMAAHAGELLQQGVQEFWNRDLAARLFGISPMPQYFWHMQDFYVAQKGLDTEGARWAQLRLSEDLCGNLFETALGKAPDEPAFTLDRIRNFEVFLLERFSRKLFTLISPVLFKKPNKKYKPSPDEPLMHLVWVLPGEPEQINQVVLTVPQACLRNDYVPETAPQTWSFPDEAFYDALVDVPVRVGTTRARLEELQALEPDDLILFEDSSADQWWVLGPDGEPAMLANIAIPDDYRLPEDLINQGQDAMNDATNPRPTLWDNLQVEVTAAFNPVKLSLRRLKEMEQGLVVEVGDLMDNRIDIEVEGNPVAWGELVVLGNRFGVRIQGMHEATGWSGNAGQNAGQALPDVGYAQNEMEQNYAPQENDDGGGEMTQELENTGNVDFELDDSDFDDLDDEEDWN